MRRLLLLVLLVALAFGAPYAAALINATMGSWSAVGIEADVSRTTMQFGQNLPRPEWVPIYPGATVVQASRLVSARAPSGFHSLELATRAGLDEVKRFYTDALTAAGFEVSDLGLWPLDARTAQLLGMDGTLLARRAASDDQINIQIRTPEGLVPSR